MTPLKNLPVAVIDVEGTGFDTNTCRIVDIAVVHHHLGSAESPRVAFRSLVKPPTPILADVVAVHGIDDAAVADAPSWEQVAGAVAQACAGRTCVAFSAPYDFRMIRAEMQRVGREELPWPWLDLLIVRKATKTRGRPGRLGEIAQEYGIALDAHGATGDALVTALLLTPLMRAAWQAGAFAGPRGAQPRYYEEDEDYEIERVDTLEALLAWQRGAALWQEADFSAYCARQGNARPPRSDWHEVEGVPSPPWQVSKRTSFCTACGAAATLGVARDGTLRWLEADGTDHACVPK